MSKLFMPIIFSDYFEMDVSPYISYHISLDVAKLIRQFEELL